MSFSEFQKQALEAHNDYRQKHKVSPLALNKDLCDFAQEWANVSNLFCSNFRCGKMILNIHKL